MTLKLVHKRRKFRVFLHTGTIEHRAGAAAALICAFCKSPNKPINDIDDNDNKTINLLFGDENYRQASKPNAVRMEIILVGFSLFVKKARTTLSNTFLLDSLWTATVWRWRGTHTTSNFVGDLKTTENNKTVSQEVQSQSVNKPSEWNFIGKHAAQPHYHAHTH